MRSDNRLLRKEARRAQIQQSDHVPSRRKAKKVVTVTSRRRQKVLAARRFDRVPLAKEHIE